ncbi:MAG: hypothetical protein ACRC6E_08315 [Fusobacteriaceae bacterium]
MAEVKKRVYQRFYMCQEDVPKNTGTDIIVLYNKPTKVIGYNDLVQGSTHNMCGINYENTTKSDLVNNLAFTWNKVDKLKRELINEKIRNNIITQRLIEHNLPVAMSPEEIQEYESNLSLMLSKEISNMMSKDKIGVREDVLIRIRNEIMKAETETKTQFKYNVVRLNNSINYNDLLEEMLMTASDKRITLKDKNKAIIDLQKAKRENINQLKELMKELGTVIRDLADTTNTSDNPKENTVGSNKVNLSSLMGAR